MSVIEHTNTFFSFHDLDQNVSNISCLSSSLICAQCNVLPRRHNGELHLGPKILLSFLEHFGCNFYQFFYTPMYFFPNILFFGFYFFFNSDGQLYVFWFWTRLPHRKTNRHQGYLKVAHW